MGLCVTFAACQGKGLLTRDILLLSISSLRLRAKRGLLVPYFPFHLCLLSCSLRLGQCCRSSGISHPHFSGYERRRKRLSPLRCLLGISPLQLIRVWGADVGCNVSESQALLHSLQFHVKSHAAPVLPWGTTRAQKLIRDQIALHGIAGRSPRRRPGLRTPPSTCMPLCTLLQQACRRQLYRGTAAPGRPLFSSAGWAAFHSAAMTCEEESAGGGHYPESEVVMATSEF